MNYSIHFRVDDGKRLLPDDFKQEITSSSEDFEYTIGKVINTKYEEQRVAFFIKEWPIIYNKLIRPKIPNYDEGVRRRLAIEDKHFKDWEVACEKWAQVVIEWEKSTVSDWKSKDLTCSNCYGAGSHGTGQSGIGDVTCVYCGGSGAISAETVRLQHQPIKSNFFDYKTFSEASVNEFDQDIHNVIEEKGPRRTLDVYVRFKLENSSH